MVAHMAYGGSQARDWIWATAVTYTETVATLDPLTHWAGPGIEPIPPQQPKLLQSDSEPTVPQVELQEKVTSKGMNPAILFLTYGKVLIRMNSYKRKLKQSRPVIQRCGLGWEERMKKKFFFFCLSRTAPAAYKGSKARSQIGAVAAGLYHSHSNARSKPCQWPTPQLSATQWLRSGIEPVSSWMLARFVSAERWRALQKCLKK